VQLARSAVAQADLQAGQVDVHHQPDLAPAHAQWRPGGVMRIVLLVDSSSAVSGMITPMRNALHAFVDGLPEEAEITFITTGSQIRIRTQPTSDRQKLHQAVGMFAPDGGANAFVDTLLEADKRFLKAVEDRRSVFVILSTDNGTNTNEQRLDAYNRFAREFAARGGRAHGVIVRGVNSGVNSVVTEHLTGLTGGYYNVINVASGIPKAMRTLTEYVAADQ
jgi:hypothetical protein